METITFIPTHRKIKWSGRKKNLNGKEYARIININFILESIIRNTLKFNKLTSSHEIYENIIARQNDQIPELTIENDMDVDTIENICDALCENKGVLIKLMKNDECFYKLNFQENE